MATEYYCPDVEVAACFATAQHKGWIRFRSSNPGWFSWMWKCGTKTGFEMLEGLTAIHFNVIFTTASNQYALRAIKIRRLDYLMKPVDKDELRTAVR